MTLFDSKYGYFSDDGTEYVIKTPRTPRPWVNVISNGDYGLVVSQNGSGYSWRTHAGLNRITRWEQDLIKDEWGKYIYIRDRSNGKIWSSGWKPVCAEPDSYRCRHGIGYSIIESVNEKIESSLLMFVPNDEPLEVWKLTLRNLDSLPRQLDLFTYMEWGMGAAPDWHREFHKCFASTEFKPEINAILAEKRLWEVPARNGHWNTDWPYVAFHSVNIPVAGFEADKEGFLGMYGDIRHPAAVSNCKLSGTTGKWSDPIASLQVQIDLAPGEEKIICFTLGAAAKRNEAERLIRNYSSEEKVNRAYSEMKAKWDGLLSGVTVSTPDDSMNSMLNLWLKYQTISGRLWGRAAYYQTGGAFGFRDQLQDSQIFLPIDPRLTYEQILLHARHQFKDGTVYHWWHPITEVGLKTDMSDDLLWLPYLVAGYIQETGDYKILKKTVPFVDEKKATTIQDHCNRAIDKVLKRRSKRGLPLIGAGDWNDGLSAVGLKWKGESIWLGHFLYKVLTDYSSILERLDKKRSTSYRKEARKLKKAINTFGWDGEWFWSATKDSGEKLGSRVNREGNIHLNPQTWSVISGVADAKRGNRAMKAVEDHLEKKAGPLLLYPAYKTPDEKIGYLTRYSPGMRENGGVYTHAATWAVIAEAMLGRGEDAFRMFSKINPINRSMNPDEYGAEPYVTPGNIDGPESPSYGRGGWTWYTGSASWLFKAGLEYILGVRAALDGLVIDPCIPAAWDSFSVTRRFRGAIYEVQVVNEQHVNTGVQTVVIDGNLASKLKSSGKGVLIPPFKKNTKHSVVVSLGPTICEEEMSSK